MSCVNLYVRPYFKIKRITRIAKKMLLCWECCWTF